MNSQIVRVIEPEEDLAKELMESVATRSGGGVLETLPQGWYPVPGDPEWYIYVDSEGTIYLLPCPDGLVWNQEMCTCWYFGGVWNTYPSSHSGPNVRDLLKADAAGATIGAVIGIGAGAATIPGIGAIPGYVAGAISGAVVGSATEGVLQLLNW